MLVLNMWSTPSFASVKQAVCSLRRECSSTESFLVFIYVQGTETRSVSTVFSSSASAKRAAIICRGTVIEGYLPVRIYSALVGLKPQVSEGLTPCLSDWQMTSNYRIISVNRTGPALGSTFMRIKLLCLPYTETDKLYIRGYKAELYLALAYVERN